ncbi:NusA-like transcription termination signal-binding factor [Candidatus Woesearchaeota archaeon]|nr:MAG: NusA-like transcription termination signal-binding factor [Candidatus Woesearchaeota archaeon]
MKIKYDIKSMRFISIFEALTGAGVKDCFEHNDRIIFIVKKGDIKKALGVKARNVDKIEKTINKKIKIVEYSDKLEEFIRNIFFPCRIERIEKKDGTILVVPKDKHDRGKMIGKNAENLRLAEKIVKRFFNDVKEIKIPKNF